MNFVIHVIDNNKIQMLQNIYEKGKLFERAGRKATSLRPPGRRYGSSATMEKSISTVLILLARTKQSGGCYADRNIP